MNNLPAYISLIFILTTILTLVLFYKATGKSIVTIIVLFAWIIIQTLLGLNLFYTNTGSIPPRFLFLIVPPIVTIVFLFLFEKGKVFIDELNIKYLTLLHVVRIPVEIVLFVLFLNKTIPQLMTFEGRNFDIIAGITAPIIYYFAFVNKKVGNGILIAWNIVCILLLLNIVVNAILSAPTPLQQFAFDQPNIAILYFPFNLLPAVIVPLVLFAHLSAIRQLLHKG